MGLIPSMAARELGIAPRTLADWAERGIIKFTRSAGGWRIYPVSEIERLRVRIDSKGNGRRAKA